MIHKTKIQTKENTEFLLFLPEDKFNNACLVYKPLMIVLKEFGRTQTGLNSFKRYVYKRNIKFETIQINRKFEQRFYNVYS